ncbi:MAG: carbon monoxide dehydrogenase subunit G [Nitrospinae bacterium]|nr:carbon monoxide dehydrogenase subunit G [Nitrospinota bacterium]
MEFNQEITVAAPREKVWDFIWQVEEFAACVPGVKDVEKIDDATYGVRVEQKVSFLKASFQLQVNIEEVRAPEYIRTVGEGKDSKLAASLKQKNEVTLEAVSENETKVRIDSSVDVFGKLGSLGFSVIKNQANKIFAEFARNVKAKVE